MNKIVVGAVTAVVVGVGAAAGWYFIGKESGPGVADVSGAPPLDCANIKTDVDATLAALPPELKATYSGLECSGTKLSFAELRFGVLGAGAIEEGAVKMTGVLVDGGFAANAKKVFNAASYPAGQAPSTERLPIASRITAAKVNIGPEAGGGVSFENFEIADLSARPFAKAPPATLADLGAAGPAEIADLLQAFGFSSISFKSVAGGPPPAAGQAPTPVVTIASVVFSAFDGQRLGAFDLTGLAGKPESGSGTFGLASLSLKGVGVGDLAAIFSSASAGGMVNSDAMEMKTLLAISADSASLKDFHVAGFSAPDDEIRLASITLDQFKALSFSKLAIDGVEGHVSDIGYSFKLAHLALKGVDFGAALRGIADGSASEPDFAKLRIDGYDLSDLAFGPKDGEKVTLASVVASSSDYVDGIATKGTGKLTGFAMPISIIPEEYRGPFTDLGYPVIKLEMTTDYSFDPKAMALDIKDVTLKLADGGALTLKVNLGNFDLKAIQAASQSMEPPAALFEAKLIAASLGYTDDSLFSRVLKLIAKEQGATPDALLEQAKAMLKMQMDAAPGPVTKAFLKGLEDFLTGQKSLTISVAPSTPLSFDEIGSKFDNPEAAAAALKLTASGK
ncbi:hypothetical protein [Zavarzinia sp.]|uniref:hypothetical protein n=1 Tax=Zavarzinia sp. TaxID=2027920 RepID=UPI003BB651CE|nr:hypothetical protein [Zavarzinia sp.]